jgi:hypothetical protein
MKLKEYMGGIEIKKGVRMRGKRGVGYIKIDFVKIKNNIREYLQDTGYEFEEEEDEY